MYVPKSGTKQDQVRRWRLSERASIGHGACHILVHELLMRFPESGFNAVWIMPRDGYRGNQVFVTNGKLAFDYRGYLAESRLMSYHWKQYENTYSGWGAETVTVKGDLCDPVAMAEIGMHIRGPEEFLHNAISGARYYLVKFTEMQKAHIGFNQ